MPIRLINKYKTNHIWIAGKNKSEIINRISIFEVSPHKLQKEMLNLKFQMLIKLIAKKAHGNISFLPNTSLFRKKTMK